MRNEYDFSNAVKNPYTRKKTSVTIRLDDEAITYFKQLAIETDLPYQTLINSFLTDCARNHKKPDLSWR